MTEQQKSERVCTRCNGAGVQVHGSDEWKCYACEGRGTFPDPDWDAILDRVLTRPRKDGTRRFRASWPGAAERTSVIGARAYFVWRLTRFHGGRDVTLPMGAFTLTSGDPWRDELDGLARVIARRALGTALAGTTRWALALGYVDKAPPGLPPTAEPCGPVVMDEHKLEEEAIELR